MKTNHKYFVADLVEEVGSLPSVAAQLVTMTSDPNCDMNSLSRVIVSDSVMTMRFLALANSAAISHGQEIRNLKSALVRLGLRKVRNVALLMGMHDMMPGRVPAGDLDMNEYWKYTLAVASCAQGLAWQQGTPSFEDAWLVGILHGIGVAVLDQKATEEFQQAIKTAQSRKISLADAEMRVLDFHHGELGARILKGWKLPPLFREVVEFYSEDYETQEVSPEAHELIKVLLNSISIVRAIGFGDNGDCDTASSLEEITQELGIQELALEALAGKVDREVSYLSKLLAIDLPANQFQQYIESSKQKVARLGLEGFDESMARANLEEQLSVARDIQTRLLPSTFPDIKDYILCAENRPSLQVSGDYFDFLNLVDGHIGLVIADVSGKGIPAALLASNAQASLRALGMVNHDPGTLLELVNNAVYESTDAERFVTLFLAVMNPSGDGFRYASAGHNPPLLLEADGTASWLKPAGTPLGMFPDMKYPVFEVKMGPGDLLVTYTDGITEAVNGLDEEFEEGGLEDTVRRNAGKSPKEIISAVMAEVIGHVSGQNENLEDKWLSPSGPAKTVTIDAGDDLTMVVLQAQ